MNTTLAFPYSRCFPDTLTFPDKHQSYSKEKLEMWANAQPDGRPAEYRWRPLFNAAKFG